MANGQLATQTAVNDVAALLGRLTSRYGDDVVWQLCTPTSLFNIEPAGVPSRAVEHALSSFFILPMLPTLGRGSARLHKAEDCCRCRAGA